MGLIASWWVSATSCIDASAAPVAETTGAWIIQGNLLERR